MLLLSILSLAATAIAAPRAIADCTRSVLEGATADYIAAQTAGSSAGIKALSTSLNYTENDKAATVATGILATALKIDHTKSTYDLTACATYTELIITDTKLPSVIGTQMRFTNGQVTKMQTLVTKKGDWLFDPASTLKWAKTEDWTTIPDAKRDTRAVIQAAADAYLDIFKDKTVKVPWGTPCDRLEGGSYTGKGTATDSCNVGIPNNIDLVNRRYVIDETLGTVDVFLSFGGPTGRPDSHEFRIESGKIRYVHTLTVMT
ncbi:hypothetical protein G7Y89_g11253 [Cudoniella acicularis]|uniref:DUF8021 domain-containing protein n=1 Tax=Cudoniella acicularis TaxID=354080 RepID=A0A8H4RET8_9HELO|nr:hypothetical protein G7Y89_g11253 [Cudoniella acicularis]